MQNTYQNTRCNLNSSIFGYLSKRNHSYTDTTDKMGLSTYHKMYQNKLFFHPSQCKELNLHPQQFNTDFLLQLTSDFVLQYSHCNSIILPTLRITNCWFYTFLGEGTVHCHNSRCLRPLILFTKLQILRAGPSFRPMYFIIMSELSKSNALPSISCKKNHNKIVNFANNYHHHIWPSVSFRYNQQIVVRSTYTHCCYFCHWWLRLQKLHDDSYIN